MSGGSPASAATEACSSKITAGEFPSRIRRRAATLLHVATRSPVILASNSRRAVAHSVASSLTSNIVCSEFPMALPVPRYFFSRHLRRRHCAGDFGLHYPMHLFGQLFHAKRFGDMRQGVSFQKLDRKSVV